LFQCKYKLNVDFPLEHSDSSFRRQVLPNLKSRFRDFVLDGENAIDTAKELWCSGTQSFAKNLEGRGEKL